MTQRQAKRRRRVTVCDPVKGRVSPNDIKAYLVATGWKLVENGCFEHVDVEKVPLWCPWDDEPAKYLKLLIKSIACRMRCAPSSALRAIEAHARGEPAVEPPATRRRRRR